MWVQYGSSLQEVKILIYLKTHRAHGTYKQTPSILPQLLIKSEQINVLHVVVEPGTVVIVGGGAVVVVGHGGLEKDGNAVPPVHCGSGLEKVYVVS